MHLHPMFAVPSRTCLFVVTLFVSSAPLLVGQSGAPALASGGVLNAADYGRAVAPGTMIAVFGTNLAPRTTSASSVPLPATLEGVSLEVIDGAQTTNAPLFFVSERQINAQLPFRISSASVQIRVRNARGASNTETVPVVARAPRLFTRTMDGKGEAILLHAASYAVVGDNSPAEPGEYLILYLTGLGAVTPELAAGQPGGDGGRLGPLNRVTDSVSVTLGGRAASMLFAGLAPGFPGVYQVNIQAPADLPAGKPAVQISIGQNVSQANVWISAAAGPKPEEAVRSALEAQARGDIEGMMAHVDTDASQPAARQQALGMLNAIRSRASFSDFRYTHLATAMGDEGSMAVVRAQVSYVMTLRGDRYPLSFGILAVMRRTGGSWKAATFEPDDLLNQELYELELAAKGAARYAGGDLLDLVELNRRINEAMKLSYLNQKKLALDATFMSVGKIPGYGDGVANIYQVLDTLSSAGEGAQELWNYGATPIFSAKMKQVGLGILQIVTEPIPPMDTMTDLMAATMEQWTHTEEVRRALGEFKRTIRKANLGQLQANPRLYLLGGRTYPPEMEVYEDTTVYHSYRQPIASIAFTAPAVLGKQIPFQVVGELQIASDSTLYPAAPYLGAQKRGSTYYLPVDLTALAEADTSTGEPILAGYGRYRLTANSTSPIVVWEITCRRGAQVLALRLRNGERALGPRIVNRYMNAIREISVPGVPAEGVRLSVGETRSGLSVMGVSSSGPDIDLTARRECINMSVLSPAVAAFNWTTTAAITGVAPGKTFWNIRLWGSAALEGVAEILKEVPVEVAGFRIPPDNSRIRVSFYGLHQYSDTTAKKTLIEFANEPAAPILWNGTRFSAAGSTTISNRQVELFFEGTVDPNTLALLTFTGRRIETTPNTSKREYEITARNMTLGTLDPTIWNLRANTVRANITVKDEYSTMSGGQWRVTSRYVDTEWTNGAYPPSLAVMLQK